MSTITRPAEPTLAGQRVRFTSYGGKVRQWMAGRTGTVVRFTTQGNPVIHLDGARQITEGRFSGYVEVGGYMLKNGGDITDRFGCAKLIDENDKFITEEVTVK